MPLPPCLSLLAFGIFSATQLVLKAHKEAVDSLSGSGSSTLGTVATVVAAANSTALECSKEIQAAMQVSLRNALKITANKPIDGPLDDLTIMKVRYLCISLSLHIAYRDPFCSVLLSDVNHIEDIFIQFYVQVIFD